MKRSQSYVYTAVAALAIVVSIPSFAADAITCTKPVNINQADAATINACLAGIGLKTAEALIAYRTAHGNFKTVGDIAVVKGIGAKRAEKLAPQLTVGNNQ